mmetsp:Transcript_25719/g.64321  ORF Transcript_25719/g.64321 Transcript_25719/m.64321 type:complete len:216 (+) Transcript_25719:797-1444(+)
MSRMDRRKASSSGPRATSSGRDTANHHTALCPMATGSHAAASAASAAGPPGDSSGSFPAVDTTAAASAASAATATRMRSLPAKMKMSFVSLAWSRNAHAACVPPALDPGPLPPPPPSPPPHRYFSWESHAFASHLWLQYTSRAHPPGQRRHAGIGKLSLPGRRASPRRSMRRNAGSTICSMSTSMPSPPPPLPPPPPPSSSSAPFPASCSSRRAI